jgi:hypothetical protein
LADTSTQPSHTPVSATVLGSTLLGSTLLGTNTQNNSPTSPPPQGGGTQPSSQGTNSQPSSQGTSSQPHHTMVGTPPSMPYLASLNIPDLTKLMNDPILHDPTWPNMPTKLPSDIPKFEGKPEKTQLITSCLFTCGVLPIALWKILFTYDCSKEHSLVPLPNGMWMKNLGPTQPLSHWKRPFYPSSNSQCTMTPVWKFYLNSNKLRPSISLIIFMNGEEEEVFAKKIPPHNND